VDSSLDEKIRNWKSNSLNQDKKNQLANEIFQWNSFEQMEILIVSDISKPFLKKNFAQIDVISVA